MAGTITVTHVPPVGRVGRIVFACTADAADGSFPDTTLPSFEGELVALATDPGATAPTANYDVTLVDSYGLDRLQGVGANRHTTNSEHANIVYSATSLHPQVAHGETLTLNIDNSSVNSATIAMTLFYRT